VSRSASAILCASAVAASLTAAFGCSKVSTSIETQHAPIGAAGGTLRYADVQDVSNLDPLLRLEAVGTDLDMFIYGFFFNIDDKMRYVPELATEVPTPANGGISKDGLTITYHLRHGVKWQDGAPFTAHDVVFTTHAILNPANNIESRSGWDQIASVEAVGDYEVKFHLKKLYAPAVATYFSESGLYPVLPAHLLEKYADVNHAPFNDHPIGTGPFKFVKWVHGDRIELAANPGYWRGAPKLRRIIYKVIPNEVTILTQLKTHEIDAWFRAPSNMYGQLKDLPGHRLQMTPSLIFSHIDFNMKNPLFADIRVRRAINYGIDKHAIIEKITHGVGLPAYSDVAPLSWAYDTDVMHYDFDPAKARSLLFQAGWAPGPDGILRKDGQSLTLTLSTVAGSANGVAVDTLVQESLKGLGVDVVLKDYPAGLFFDSAQNGGILNAGKYDMASFSWVAGVDPDDSSLYMCDMFPPAGQNNLFWCDPTLDAAERGALGTYDQIARKKYYAVIQRELADQSVTIFTYFQRQLFVTPLSMTGFVPAPATTSNWNTWEWSI
jgi:peptide/nickel transport system substrate-binding protein